MPQITKVMGFATPSAIVLPGGVVSSIMTVPAATVIVGGSLFDGPAELPRSLPPTSDLDTTGWTVITVGSSGEDYSTLDAAFADSRVLTENTVIEITSTESLTGQAEPRAGKTGAFWTVVRTSAIASIPSAGNRVDSTDATNMPTLLAPLSGTTWLPVIDVRAGAQYYKFIGIKFTITADSTNRERSSYIDVAYSNGGNQNVLSDYPDSIIFDRCVFDVPNPSTGQRNMSFGINFGATNCGVINSWGNITRRGGQGGIIAWFGHSPGPCIFENNYQLGTGNVITGGVVNPPTLGYMGNDITIRRNHFHKPPAILDGTGGYTVLNMFEIKTGIRMVIEQNIFEGSETDAQAGMGILLRNVNQSAGSGNDNMCTDITFRWNLIQNTPGCMDMAARGSQVPATNFPMQRVSIHDNLFVEIGTSAAKPSGLHNQWRFNNEITDWDIRHNTFADPGTASEGFMYFNNSVPGTGFVFKDNIGWRGAFGMRAQSPSAAEGLASLDLAVPPSEYDFDYNVIVGAPSASYPAGSNEYPAVSGFNAANFRDVANRDFRLIAGSTYSTTGTDPASDGTDRGCDVQTLCGSDYETPASGSKLFGVRHPGT